MKKFVCSFFAIFLFSLISSCGYTPIFSTQNLNFEVVNVYIDGDKKIGKEIETSLKQLLDRSSDSTEIDVRIKSSKTKDSKSKSSSGKTLSYRLTLNTEITITHVKSGKTLLKDNNTLSQSFTVQDQIYSTERMENKITSDLIYRLTQNLITKISQIKVNDS
jgi:outer membrane lipopolysaccharide assembly protein LptE/RlpB